MELLNNENLQTVLRTQRGTHVNTCAVEEVIVWPQEQSFSGSPHFLSA